MGHENELMLPGCLPCVSPEKPGELKPTLLGKDVLENNDEDESRLSFHQVGVAAVPALLMRESIESRRS